MLVSLGVSIAASFPSTKRIFGNPSLFAGISMIFQGVPSRFTSQPEARGSGPEAVFRFLGSGVDSRGEKGEKGRRDGRCFLQDKHPGWL